MPFMIVKKIIRQHVELTPSTEGMTYGQQLDNALNDAIHDGAEVGEITFGFEGDEWHEYRLKTPTFEGQSERWAPQVTSKAKPKAY